MAEVKVLIEGYTNADSQVLDGEEKTCPTISLVKDEGIIMVVDPGVLDSQQILVNKLEEHGVSVNDVNFVCITHSHIDHYRNIGMFPYAKTLEYFGIWQGGSCEDWKEKFTENIRIIKTPGHDNTSITLLVKTNQGIVAICGDVFWKNNYPEKDAYAQDDEQLQQSRKTVLKEADFIIPGHGPMYRVENEKNEESVVESLSEKFKVIFGKKIANGKLGKCRNCKTAFKSQEDRCACQEWLCYNCCECDEDCPVCVCKHRKWKK